MSQDGNDDRHSIAPAELSIRTQNGDGVFTEDMPEGFLAAGQVLGDRYQIRSQLGRGGMGEVWRAFDLKLRVEVALKALRRDLFNDEKRLEMLRQEVRAAREVVSPNVCRIFDLIEAGGSELVSMEYVDGGTLLEVLYERGPLDLKEAQDIASQFLAGLEAIHKAGLIHRDVKPENIMLTRAGRVVVMDFGLARQGDSGAGTVAGTPAYMAPEQAAGLKVDARADVYSAGVVLAEMVSPEGIKSFESRQSIWEGVRSEPATLPDTPWAPVLKKAVAKEPDRRYNSAHTLTRALEDVTLRVEGAEDLTPYPGLASFTEEDAEYFFGREAEIEQMWRKLERPHLLALIGPSGAGKSSFIRAGLIPSAPANWGLVHCTPGTTPVLSLSRALGSELAGDAKAVDLLLRFDDPDVAVEVFSRWRQGREQTLLIVDQFEELFTQNPPEVQARFAELLGRLVLDADVFVLLSMRDDFFFHCHQYEALKPVVTDLTLLGPPTGPALRRALVQPAMKCGYRFEDDELVDEMLADVEGERGALPLLAFAMSRLWEKRDRDNGLLTRTAFRDIGGVGGALARHAQETIDRIGSERVPIVRELFRNLVTAEGTRAVREWDELFSVFNAESGSRSPGDKPPRAARDWEEERKKKMRAGGSAPGSQGLPQNPRAGGLPPGQSDAEEVLRALIDARLLTSYEVREDEHDPIRRVEIIHESLLANWPRLVRWQTQDVEGAQLRDELRQAAKSWDEHGRQDNRLWTGTAYREFSLWRERYPGALTAIEEAFAEAMASLAGRRRRRRRMIVSAVFVALVAGLAVVGSFWQRSVRETRRAEAAANRAEASKLLTLGHAVLPKHRTDALAYTIASLRRADTPEARRFAVEVLWAGPTVTVLNDQGEEPWRVGFSSDGSVLAAGDIRGGVRVFSDDGGPPKYLQFEPPDSIFAVEFETSGRSLVVSKVKKRHENRPSTRETLVWSLPDWTLLRSISGAGYFDRRRGAVVTAEYELAKDGRAAVPYRFVLRRWLLDGGDPERLGSVEGTRNRGALDPSGEWLAVLVGTEIRLYRLDALETAPPRTIGRYESIFSGHAPPAFDPFSRSVAACDIDGNVAIWPVEGDGSRPLRRIDATGNGVAMWTGFSDDGARLGIDFQQAGTRIWDLTGPPAADALRIESRGMQMNGGAFHPSGAWIATTGGGFGVALWRTSGQWCRVLPGHDTYVRQLAFAPDGRRLYSIGHDPGLLLAWALTGTEHDDVTTIFQRKRQWGFGVAADPQGRFVAASAGDEGIWRIPLSDGDPEQIDGLGTSPFGPRVDPQGRVVVSNRWTGINPGPAVDAVDLVTGDRWEFDLGDDELVTGYDFDPSGRLLISRGAALHRWDFRAGADEVLLDDLPERRGSFYGDHLVVSPDGSKALMILEDHSVALVDLEQQSFRILSSHGPCTGIAFDQSGEHVVSGGDDGVVRVGPVSGAEPHLLYRHEEGMVYDVEVSPDGRWIASGGFDGGVRLWPMPDMSKPPFHTLPFDELMATLEALTNLRAVPDPTTDTGYLIEADMTAYRGWREVPEW